MRLLVFSDDWGRHPSSCQHLVRHLLPTTPTTWVNTIGMRRPRFEWYTVRRGFEKFGQWFGPKRSSGADPEHLRVISPVLWPGAARSWERAINRRLFERALRECVDDQTVAVTTMPTVANLIGRLPVRRWVYYCVDDFTSWPGLDHAAILAQENVLIDRADAIVAVSEVLVDRVRARGRTASLLTHGVDLDYWKSASPTTASPFAGLPRPWLLFWGLIDQRMDPELLRATSGSIVLVGPQDNPPPPLAQLSNVVIRPGVASDELAGIAAHADVLLMPYIDAPVTRAIQPLKLKEYLATGKPVVARELPAVREWSDCLDLAGSPAEFSEAVRRRAAEGIAPEQAAARARLADESWTAKAARFRQILENL